MLKKLLITTFEIIINITIEVFKFLINILSYIKEKIKIEKEKKYKVISVDENKDYKITITEEIEDYKPQSFTPPVENKNYDKNCPYCHKALEKPPQRKKQCPYCKQYMYVRTRLKDRKKVLVTKEEADRIDLEWEKYQFEEEIKTIRVNHNIALSEWESVKNKLRQEFGRDPLFNDVLWAILNDRLNKAIIEKDNYKVRIIFSDMIKILRNENKLKSVLGYSLMICYLDCDNYSKMSLPKSKWFAPSYLSEIINTIKSLNLSMDEVKKIFFEQANSYQKALGLTYSPNDAWNDIKEHILPLK